MRSTTAGVPGVFEARNVRASLVGSVLGSAVVVFLCVMPLIAYQDVTDQLVTLFVLVVIGSMWNLLAGFAGLVSVGQQAYIGVGAHSTLGFSLAGVQPWLAIVFGALSCAVVAIPTSLLVFRLRGDYFAVGTWVIAEVYRLVIIRIDVLGGPSGRSLTQLSSIDPTLTAVRDNEAAAGSLGVNVPLAKRIVYLVAAAGTGGAGGVLLVQALSVQPNAIFSVQWSAYMIFIVVLGGIGRIEGPILGAVVFFVLQSTLANYGAWYLVLLGAVSIVAAIWLPQGVWGFISERTGFRFLPIGYRVDGISTASVREPSRSRG